MPEDEEEKEEEVEVEKPKRSFMENVPPMYLIMAGAVTFIAIVSYQRTKDNVYLIMIGITVAVLYFISRYVEPRRGPITPKEAEKLVLTEINRKINWGQWPLGTKFGLSPVNNNIHRDGKGMYYGIPAWVTPPFENKLEWYTCEVMMDGPERGHVSVVRAVGEPTGRELVNEKTILPPAVKLARKDPFMADMLRKIGRF